MWLQKAYPRDSEYVAGQRPSKKVTFSGRSNAWSNLSYSTVAFVANAKIVLDNTS